MTIFLFGILAIIFSPLSTVSEIVEPVVSVPYLWKNIDFLYPSDKEREDAIQTGNYIPEKVALNDVDVWPDSVKGNGTENLRIFIVTPAFASGTPAVLSTLTNIKKDDSFLLSPFPNWQMQNYRSNCNGLVNVDKIHIDRCGLLWVTDMGRLNEFVAPKRICPPKILIFDLQNNDKQILKYEIPNGVITSKSGPSAIVTDSKSDNCSDTTAYILDGLGHGLIVFDLPTRTSWRVEHNFFHPEPLRGTFNISGVTFDLLDGVFGLSLGPQVNGDRNLYFHSLASLRENWVPTSVLKNRALVAQRDLLRSSFHTSDEFRVGQCSLEVMTDDGIMIYSDVSRNAIMCWNIATKPTLQNTQLIYQDNENLQFISGMKLKGDQLWIASNKVQNIIKNITDTGFRFRIVQIKSVRQLLETKGRKCLQIR